MNGVHVGGGGEDQGEQGERDVVRRLQHGRGVVGDLRDALRDDGESEPPLDVGAVRVEMIEERVAGERRAERLELADAFASGRDLLLDDDRAFELELTARPRHRAEALDEPSEPDDDEERANGCHQGHDPSFEDVDAVRRFERNAEDRHKANLQTLLQDNKNLSLALTAFKYRYGSQYL